MSKRIALECDILVAISNGCHRNRMIWDRTGVVSRGLLDSTIQRLRKIGAIECDMNQNWSISKTGKP